MIENIGLNYEYNTKFLKVYHVYFFGLVFHLHDTDAGPQISANARAER